MHECRNLAEAGNGQVLPSPSTAHSWALHHIHLQPLWSQLKARILQTFMTAVPAAIRRLSSQSLLMRLPILRKASSQQVTSHVPQTMQPGQAALLGLSFALRMMQLDDYEIKPSEIEIMVSLDGTPLVLGRGACGQVALHAQARAGCMQ